MTAKLSRVERAALPALVSVVPKFLAWTLTYDGWLARVREVPLAHGMRGEVLRAAFDAWREPPMAMLRDGWKRNVGADE